MARGDILERGNIYFAYRPRVEQSEIILIGADEDVRGELGISLDPEHETMDTAEIFRDLHMERSKHPLEPLFQGKWI